MLQESPPRPWMVLSPCKGSNGILFLASDKMCLMVRVPRRLPRKRWSQRCVPSPRERGRGSIALCSKLVRREVQLREGWASLLRMGRCWREGASQNLTRAPQPARGSEEVWEGAQLRRPAGKLAVT